MSISEREITRRSLLDAAFPFPKSYFKNTTPIRDLIGYAVDLEHDEPFSNEDTLKFKNFETNQLEFSEAERNILEGIFNHLAFRWRDGVYVQEVPTIESSRVDMESGRLREFDGFEINNEEGEINFLIVKKLLEVK